MNVTEFFDRFNVLYNNIDSNAAPGLNGYEISVCLTKGQEEIIKNHFNPQGNKYQEGFSDSPKRDADFKNLIKTSATPQLIPLEPVYRLDSRSVVFKIPDDAFILLNEQFHTNLLKYSPLMPKYLTPAEFNAALKKPFKYPSKAEAWVIQGDHTEVGGTIEVLSNPPVQTVTFRYIKRPAPIIVEDLTQYGTSINGVSAVSECELDSSIHEEILQRAVEIAKAAYTGDVNTSIQMGQRSE